MHRQRHGLAALDLRHDQQVECNAAMDGGLALGLDDQRAGIAGIEPGESGRAGAIRP
jgi:hypothetical protein